MTDKNGVVVTVIGHDSENSKTCSLIRWPLIVPGRGLTYGSRDSLRHVALPVTVPANLLDSYAGSRHLAMALMNVSLHNLIKQ